MPARCQTIPFSPVAQAWNLRNQPRPLPHSPHPFNINSTSLNRLCPPKFLHLHFTALVQAIGIHHLDSSNSFWGLLCLRLLSSLWSALHKNTTLIMLLPGLKAFHGSPLSSDQSKFLWGNKAWCVFIWICYSLFSAVCKEKARPKEYVVLWLIRKPI